MQATTQLILVAGGLGTRLGHSNPKALVPLGGVPLVTRTLQAFKSINLSNDAIVVHPEGYRSEFEAAIDTKYPSASIQLVVGGQERFDSVAQGLRALAPESELVVIHDAARPFIQEAIIQNVINAAAESGAATVAARCTDTILQVNNDGWLDSTPNRNSMWACQTPQAFQRRIIEEAYAQPVPESSTDDATLVHRAGTAVRIIEGPDTNIKITTPFDLVFAEHLLKQGRV